MNTEAATSPGEVDEQTGSRLRRFLLAQDWRFTSYFGLVAGLAALAAGAAIAYVFVQTDRDSRAAARDDARFAADTAARQLGDTVALIKATVANLAATPNLDQAVGQPSCTLSFSQDNFTRGHVDIVRQDGSVVCSSRPRTGAKPLAGYADAGWLRRAGTAPVLLAPVVDAATGDRSVVSAAAAPGGRLVVAAFVALEPVGGGLASVYGGGQPAEFLLTSDDGHTVLARSVDPERWVGRSVAGTEFAQAAGKLDRPDVDGTPRLYQDAAVPGVGWTVHVGEDKAAALTSGHRLRDRQLTIILIGFALVLLAALAVYRRVATPIRRLGAAVRATTALSPPEPVPASGPLEVMSLGDDINGLISSVQRELHHRRRAEETTLASERSYRLLFESSPLPMWIHDAETLAIVEVNQAAVNRYGYSPEEFLRLAATDIAAPGADAGDGPLEAVPSELPALSRHLTKGGREIKARTISHAVMFDGRSARCVVSEDVGERERLESQLRQAQKLEAVGQLAGGVAHDFNNLLTVISGYAAMASNRIGAGPGARELTEIDRAAERAVQLTAQLLAFSRQQVLEPVVLDLNEVIAAVTPMLARLIGEDVEIGVLSDDDPPHVLADRGQIELAIVNLAVNARDAMPHGGTLTIETRSEELDERNAAEHGGVKPGVYACLVVTDTGVGIDGETQSHIFEPFFTTKEVGQGTGLGLATVHGIISQSGGHVAVSSEPGLGTTFKVYLPAAAGEAVVRGFKPAQRPDRLGGTETILLCEDDELVRTLIETIFTEQGYRVLSASRPGGALDLATAHAGQIDVVVTDVVMPEMSGPELVEQLEKVRPGVKAVFLSGYTADTVRGRPMPSGSVFLQKPFDDIELLQTIRSLVGPTPPPTSADAGTGDGIATSSTE